MALNAFYLQLAGVQKHHLWIQCLDISFPFVNFDLRLSEPGQSAKVQQTTLASFKVHFKPGSLEAAGILRLKLGKKGLFFSFFHNLFFLLKNNKQTNKKKTIALAARTWCLSLRLCAPLSRLYENNKRFVRSGFSSSFPIFFEHAPEKRAVSMN